MTITNVPLDSGRARIIRGGLLVTVVIWSAYLLLQNGNPFDEGEHAHVAWLMDHGRRPLDDFFEHHQPLLWDMLRLGFRLGFHGAWVILWGRILAVLSGVTVVGALLLLGRRWTVSPGGRALPGVTGALAFILITALQGELLVVRPETVSLAFFMVALLCWCWNGSVTRLRWQALVAGALFAAAAYASPRQALLAGLFLLLETKESRGLWSRYVAFGVGAVAFLSLYTVVSGYSLEKVRFNVQFSALLQTLGSGRWGQTLAKWIWFCASLVVLAGVQMALGTGARRLRGLLLAGYCIVVFALCADLARHYLYEQAFAAFTLACCVMLTWADAGMARLVDRRTGLVVLTACLPLFAYVAAKWTSPRFELIQMLRTRELLASLIPPGEKAMVYSFHSPVAAEDASYYPFQLIDVRDRLCRAANMWTGAPKLPDCNVARDIEEKRPYLLDNMYPDFELAKADQPALRAFMKQQYDRLPQARDPGYPAAMRGVLLRHQ